MTSLDILITAMVAHVNQQWFTDAVIEIIQRNNNAMRRRTPVPDDLPTSAAASDTAQQPASG